jgi:hypothetical protein
VGTRITWKKVAEKRETETRRKRRERWFEYVNKP